MSCVLSTYFSFTLNFKSVIFIQLLFFTPSIVKCTHIVHFPTTLLTIRTFVFTYLRAKWISENTDIPFAVLSLIVFYNTPLIKELTNHEYLPIFSITILQSSSILGRGKTSTAKKQEVLYENTHVTRLHILQRLMWCNK